MTEISRRGFLKALGIGAAAAAASSFAPGCTAHLEEISEKAQPRPANPLVNTQELVDFFREKRVEPNVFDNGGDRTLLLIGELHLGYGDSYNLFFDYIKNHGNKQFDKIFMELVHTHGNKGRDPCYADHEYSCKVNEETQTPFEKFRKEDRQGYYRLSETFDVRGVEDPDLRYDYFLISRINDLIDNLYNYDSSFNENQGKKNHDVEKRILSLQSQFRTGLCKLPRKYPAEASPEEQREYTNCVRKLYKKVYMDKRNEQFVGMIDRHLKKNGAGAFIVGINHAELWSPDENPTDIKLPEMLKEKGINVVYVNIDHINTFLWRSGIHTPKPYGLRDD